MGKFRELTMDEATSITGGTSINAMIESINNGTYVGGSIVWVNTATGMIWGTYDLQYGSPSRLYFDNQLVYTGTPSPFPPGYWG